MVAPRPRRARRPGDGRRSKTNFLIILALAFGTFYYMFSEIEETPQTKQPENQSKPDYLRGTPNANNMNNNIYDNEPPPNSMGNLFPPDNNMGGDPNMNMNNNNMNNPNRPEGYNNGISNVPEDGYTLPNDFNNNARDPKMDEMKQIQENELNQELMISVNDAKMDIEIAEGEEIAKDEKDIIGDALSLAEGEIQEVMQDVLENEDIEISEQQATELAGEVKLWLEKEVEDEFVQKSQQIMHEKEEELDMVAREDRGIFTNPADLKKDISEMEKFIVDDMNREIDQAAIDVKSTILDKAEQLEQRVIEERVGVHITEEDLKTAEKKVRHKHEQAEAFEEMKTDAANAELSSVIDNVKLDVEKQGDEEITKEEEHLLRATIKDAEKNAKAVVEEIMNLEDIPDADFPIDDIIKEVNSHLEAEVKKEFEEVSEKIVREKEEEIDETVRIDRSYISNPLDIKNDVERMEEYIVDELNEEIDKAAERINDSIKDKALKIEKKVIREKTGIKVKVSDLKEMTENLIEEDKDSENNTIDDDEADDEDDDEDDGDDQGNDDGDVAADDDDEEEEADNSGDEDDGDDQANDDGDDADDDDDDEEDEEADKLVEEEKEEEVADDDEDDDDEEEEEVVDDDEGDDEEEEEVADDDEDDDDEEEKEVVEAEEKTDIDETEEEEEVVDDDNQANDDGDDQADDDDEEEEEEEVVDDDNQANDDGDDQADDDQADDDQADDDDEDEQVVVEEKTNTKKKQKQEKANDEDTEVIFEEKTKAEKKRKKEEDILHVEVISEKDSNPENNKDEPKESDEAEKNKKLKEKQTKTERKEKEKGKKKKET